MVIQDELDVRRQISRRLFLKSPMGSVCMTIGGVPACSGIENMADTAMLESLDAAEWSPPGAAARQPLDGAAEGTGGRFNARDFNACDLQQWPSTQWYAMYLGAESTSRKFRALDISSWAADELPVRVILGNHITTDQHKTIFGRRSDQVSAERALNYKLEQSSTNGRGVEHLPEVDFDLIVKPGNRPDFVGQAVALLLFDSVDSYRAAKARMDANGASHQVYGNNIEMSLDDNSVAFESSNYSMPVADSTVSSNDFCFDAVRANPSGLQPQDINSTMPSDSQPLRNPNTRDLQRPDMVDKKRESGLIWYDEKHNTMNVLLGTQSPEEDLQRICSMYLAPESLLKVDNAVLSNCVPQEGNGSQGSQPFPLMLALCARFTDGNPVKLELN